jgi:hypothetical protein
MNLNTLFRIHWLVIAGALKAFHIKGHSSIAAKRAYVCVFVSAGSSCHRKINNQKEDEEEIMSRGENKEENPSTQTNC